MVYDEIHGYALTAINPFFDDSSPKDHVFVDEFSCIGMSRVFNSSYFDFSLCFWYLGSKFAYHVMTPKVSQIRF